MDSLITRDENLIPTLIELGFKKTTANTDSWSSFYVNSEGKQIKVNTVKHTIKLLDCHGNKIMESKEVSFRDFNKFLKS